MKHTTSGNREPQGGAGRPLARIDDGAVQAWLFGLPRSGDRSARHASARRALHAVLARYLGRAFDDVQLDSDVGGKPRLSIDTARAAEMDLRFSLSHSGRLALVAIAHDREVGIDLELTSAHRPVDRVARRCLSEGERADLATAPTANRNEAFYRYWVAREAYAKATGRGLGRTLREVEVATAPGQPQRYVRRDGGPPGFRLHELPAPAGYVAGLAVEE